MKDRITAVGSAIVLEAGTFDALIFDCDGTLVHSAPLYLRSLQDAFSEYGHTLDEGWYLARTGLTPLALLAAYDKEIKPLPATENEILNHCSAAFQRNLHTLEEVKIVADIVRAWHGKVPMAVASNGQRHNVEGSLSAVGLLPFFDTVVSVEDVTHGKPAPDIYLEAAKRLRVEPMRCFVLEDSDEGMCAARAAGIEALDVRPLLKNR